ncbi:MAG: alpha-ribazole phosphatase family protein [Bacteroidales bacterium]
MEVYIVRHTSVNVPKGVCYGQSDVSVSETFEDEAKIVYENLKALKESFGQVTDFDFAFCSPLSRCVKLAEYCGYFNAERDDRIKEINFGEWELCNFNEIKDPVLQEWYNDYLNVRVTGGESFKDQYARVASFLSGLKEKEFSKNGSVTRIVVFAHGGVLICARIFVGEITGEQAFNSLTPYGGIVKIVL